MSMDNVPIHSKQNFHLYKNCLQNYTTRMLFQEMLDKKGRERTSRKRM